MENARTALKDTLINLLKQAKDEQTYIANDELAVIITTALEEEDAENVAEKVLDIIDFSRD